jgi:hypothetical protein
MLSRAVRLPTGVRIPGLRATRRARQTIGSLFSTEVVAGRDTASLGSARKDPQSCILCAADLMP